MTQAMDMCVCVCIYLFFHINFRYFVEFNHGFCTDCHRDYLWFRFFFVGALMKFAVLEEVTTKFSALKLISPAKTSEWVKTTKHFSNLHKTKWMNEWQFSCTQNIECSKHQTNQIFLHNLIKRKNMFIYFIMLLNG